MMNNDTEKYLPEVLQQVQQGKVVLFLGAGASHAAGGPTGEKLTEMIKEKFPSIDQSLNNFIEVCQDVIDTPPYNRNELEEFIRNKLNTVQPTGAHRIMTKYDWAAIFTTNFDDLIEVAYRTAPDRLKPCQPIYSEQFQVNPSDRNKVCLFKIMGSITATEGETGQMVLSRADYNRALIRRRKYLELLSDFVKTGTIVFIGYSFGDRLALDIIDDIIEIYGKDRLPWSYALFEQLELDEKVKYMFSSRKIIPIKCNFEKFFEYIEKNYKVPVEIGISKNVFFKLLGYSLELSEEEARQYAEYFEILNEEKINQEPGNKDDFFKGTNKNWGAFREEWDFKRDLYISSEFKRKVGGKVFSGCLKDKVFSELKKYDIKDNKILLVTGMAGVGKTTMLRRLAYDVYKNAEAPVIFINPAGVSFDYKLLSGFIENLNHQINQKIPEGEHVQPIKPIIIFDDASSQIRNVSRLIDYLTSRGRPALIIAAERKGEWDVTWKTFTFRIHEKNVYELDEELNDQEKSKIIDHFSDLGYIQIKGTFWDDIIEREFENSFFATIYTLVHPSRKPLNEIIRDQYQNLTDLTQDAFRYICCFHQFNLPINLELLVRSLKCPYGDFHTEVIGKDAAKVIFEEQDEIGNLLYRTHHRIIARKTVEFFFGDPEEQKNLFLEILKEAVLTNRKEREICEKFLVEYIGPNAKLQILSYDQQRQIFRTICEKNPIRSLVHHWGILETDDRQYLEAEKLLKWALELPKGDIEAYRGESDQVILTSLGNLCSHMGMESIKQGEQAKTEEYFEKAEDCFRNAKHGEFPNAYAYHAHAHMWYLRGNRTANDSKKLDHQAKALEILSVARDNLNEDGLQPIYELETKVWGEIGDKTKINKNLEILRDKFNTASGYYLYAQLLWHESREKEEDEREKLSRLSLRKVEKGLKFFPYDESCLRLRAKLIKELNPDNLSKYYESLQDWKATSTTPNAWLLYELGRTAFLLGYYDYSKEFFKELETGIGIGHRLRPRSRHPIRDEKGNEKEFEGTIVNIFSSYEGDIRCDALRSLRYSIAFRPIACRFTPSRGDSVKLYIAFSFRGPIATNVRKI
ncbi:MAG: SIR2 family protein [Pseudomonadota bacterium]